MMRLWDPTSSLPPDIETPVFVRSADQAALMALLAIDGAPCPQVVEVRPNGELALPMLQFLHLVTSTMAAPPFVRTPLQTQPVVSRPVVLDCLRGLQWERRIDLEYRQLLCATRDILVNLRSFNAEAVFQASEALESASLAQQSIAPERCHPLTPTLAAFLQSFAVKLLMPMEQGTLHIHESASGANKAWWNTLSPLYNICTSLAQDIDRVAQPPRPPAIEAVRTWILALRTHIELMYMKVGRSHTSIFEQASAWFAACALRHMERAQVGWGILFMHRAVDWLLMAKLAKLGYLDFTKPGGRYKPVYLYAGQDDRPSFSGNLDLLRGQTNLQGLEPLFRDLNEWRNLLPYTHHMTVARDDKASALCSEVHAKLPAFANSAAWKTALEIFVTEPPIDLEGLLDPDGLLRSCLELH